MNDAPTTMSLHVLSQGMPGLTSAGGTILAEAASVCLEAQNHPTSVTLHLTGFTQNSIHMDRPTVDDQCRRSHNDMQEATERGACGIAILTIKELVGLVVVERSAKGPGFDYWLGEENDDLLFANKSRLEVSGILSGSQTVINSRVKQKREQIRRSDSLAPGYVAVVEFGKPLATVVLG